MPGDTIQSAVTFPVAIGFPYPCVLGLCLWSWQGLPLVLLHLGRLFHLGWGPHWCGRDPLVILCMYADWHATAKRHVHLCTSCSLHVHVALSSASKMGASNASKDCTNLKAT